MKRAGILLYLACVVHAAVAQPAELDGLARSIDAQRKQIGMERSKLEAGFVAEEAVCHEKFLVNACLDKVHSRRRQSMAELRQQEILLNDQERQLKGAEQVRKTEEKSSPERLQQGAEQRAKALDDYQARLAREKEKQQGRSEVEGNEGAAREVNAEKLLANQKKNQARVEVEAKAAEDAKKFAERQQKAQRRRAQHEAEQLKRSKPPAKPLPLPDQ